MPFVNREQELEALDRWWDVRGARLAFVWGRRRVGKTALIERFAVSRRAVFHTGSRRPVVDELSGLSRAARGLVAGRDLSINQFHDWTDLFETLARAAGAEPILLVLDEFPELVAVAPELPSVIRAVWDRIVADSSLRLLLCGSAVRTMEAMREERAPLYGRADLSLLVHPFRPHEAGLLLPGLRPADRAVVWGILGGVPLYLQWWDEHRSLRENLMRLACLPGAPLLNEGMLVLATEGESGELSRQVLHAVAAGRTKHNEIADAIRADPTRTLERLVELRLVERLSPVTEDPRRTRRRAYQIADNFLAFWLRILDRYRPEIDRGLGRTIMPALVADLDDFMGPRWEEAYRSHLRRLAHEGLLAPDVVAVGPFWTAADDPQEIDAVVLAGRERRAVLVGEAKWARSVDARGVLRDLERKSQALPSLGPDLRMSVCARERVNQITSDVLAVTAADIF